MALKASVHIETAFQNGKTVLKKSFCNSPFKIADVTEDKRSKEIRLMLMSSSPGVLDSDEYNFEISVAERCSLQIETQSYQRIFQMKYGARQTMRVNVGRGAAFVYLPHPVVPHENSAFLLRNKIYLAKDSKLMWGEVLSCGRKLNNEIFLFSSYHSLTEIFIEEKLAVKENLLLRPMEVSVKGIGQLEDYTHQATFIYVNQEADIILLTENFAKELNQQQNIEFGISELSVNGLIVRLVGYKAEQLFELLKKLSVIISSSMQKKTEQAYVA